MKLNTIIVLTVAMCSAFVNAKDLQLPDPLVTNAGKKVTTSDAWENTRRSEILELFRKHVYGRAPIGRPKLLRFEVVEVDKEAMEGKAIFKNVHIHFQGKGGKGKISLRLFIPKNALKPVPGYILICNRGKENIDPTRKEKSQFWPAERIVERGYAALAFHVSDLDPDKYDGFQNGVHGIYDPKNSKRAGDAWGAIAAWGWGASRVMDYLETDIEVDAKRVGIVGHSRAGKASLWCGARDERFALVVSNNSGCSGAALARNKKGESVKRINSNFPHWFCDNYKKFNDKETDLPIDQHSLISLIAPRLAYVASASKDAWADPEGEFLSCVYADPVYQLFGMKGVGAKQMPGEQKPLHLGRIGHHIRTGKHNLTSYDWDQFMNFSDRYWKNQVNKK